MMMYRYIFVLLDDAMVMNNSQKTRLGYNGFKNSYRSLGLLVGSLFIKSLDKGDDIYATLNSRGYTGNLMFFGDIERPKTSYVAFVGVITSYSIHYTKLYDVFLKIQNSKFHPLKKISKISYNFV